MPNDLELVHLAFNRVKELSLNYGDSIPRQAISEGFLFNGEKILLDNRAVDIFKPTIVTVLLIGTGNSLKVIRDRLLFVNLLECSYNSWT
jgi:hypothetical protein